MDELELGAVIDKLKEFKNDEPFATQLDGVIDTLEEMGKKINTCSINFAHTRQWCGHPLCRES